MSLTFQKKKEDFTCEHCGVAVIGNGFTNHCPQCLWSKHVDVHPGDRRALEACGALMKPVRIEGSSGSKGVSEYMIVHVCEGCGYERRNRVRPEDNFDAVLKVIALTTK